MGKAGGKKGKGPVKPDYMTPEYFQQSQDLPLLVEIAKKPNWKPPTPMSRAQALCHLWTHSLQTPKRKQDIVDQGGLQAAVSSCNPSQSMTDRAPGIGLIHSIALDPELCETVVSARAIAVALDLCSSSSLTAQAAAVGTLSKLAEHPDTRKRVVRDIVAFGWTSILDLIRSGASRLEAKADGAKVLAICSQHGEGNQASVDAIRADLGSNTLALEYLMDCACDSTTPKVGNVALRESAALFLRYMSEDDDNKNKLATRDNLSRLVTVMAGDSASLQCKASACCVVFNVCTQTKEKALMETMPFRNGMGGGAGAWGDGAGGEGGDDSGEGGDGGVEDQGDALAAGGSGGGGESGDPMSATGASMPFSDMPTVNAAMGGSMLTGGFGDDGGAGGTAAIVPSSEELKRLEMVIQAGGVRPLVVLCAGPGGFDVKPAADEGKGGKKGKKKGGKKKKEPPVTAEMAEAQLAAAGVLRRMTVRSDWAAAVAQAEGARLLMPLMAAKNDQTRWHAQAALWNISGDSVLNENKAPGFLTTVVPYKGDKTGVFLTKTSTRSKDARPTTAPV